MTNNLSYSSLYPNYFIMDGFATLMSHYSLLYCLYKDIGVIPTIIKLDTKNKKNKTAMDFFNNFSTPVIMHEDAFPNIKNIYNIMSEKNASQLQWNLIDLRNLEDYDSIVNMVNSYKNYNLLYLWTLHHKLITKYLSEIINFLFKFDDQIISECKNILPSTPKEIVGVCVRTEYKKINTPHTKLTLNYYEAAMKQFDTDKTKYVVFSDDINEAKSMFASINQAYDIIYTNNMQSAIGLCAMSMCNHIISANSSFSYWAGLLNKNLQKKIICPTHFIEVDKDPFSASMLNYTWYPSDWIGLDII